MKVEWDQGSKKDSMGKHDGLAFASYSGAIADFVDENEEKGLTYPPNFAAVSPPSYSFRKLK